MATVLRPASSPFPARVSTASPSPSSATPALLVTPWPPAPRCRSTTKCWPDPGRWTCKTKRTAPLLLWPSTWRLATAWPSTCPLDVSSATTAATTTLSLVSCFILLTKPETCSCSGICNDLPCWFESDTWNLVVVQLCLVARKLIYIRSVVVSDTIISSLYCLFYLSKWLYVHFLTFLMTDSCQTHWESMLLWVSICHLLILHDWKKYVIYLYNYKKIKQDFQQNITSWLVLISTWHTGESHRILSDCRWTGQNGRSFYPMHSSSSLTPCVDITHKAIQPQWFVQWFGCVMLAAANVALSL